MNILDATVIIVAFITAILSIYNFIFYFSVLGRMYSTGRLLILLIPIATFIGALSKIFSGFNNTFHCIVVSNDIILFTQSLDIFLIFGISAIQTATVSKKSIPKRKK